MSGYKAKEVAKTNEVGNRHLHDRHNITLESTDHGFAHAKIRDQLFIDSLLLKDQLTMKQHAEAERILLLCQFAGVFLGSPSLTSVRIPGNKPDPYSSALMALSRIMKKIQTKHGLAGVKAIEDHVIEDRRTSNKKTIELLAKILTR